MAHMHRMHDVMIFIVLPTAPTAAPSGVNGKNTSSTSLTISWNALTAGQNGIITNYTVYYRATGPWKGSMQSVNLGSSARQANLSNLFIYTGYNISVSASTSAGEGPPSSGKIITTGEASKFAFNNSPVDSIIVCLFLWWGMECSSKLYIVCFWVFVAYHFPELIQIFLLFACGSGQFLSSFFSKRDLRLSFVCFSFVLGSVLLFFPTSCSPPLSLSVYFLSM